MKIYKSILKHEALTDIGKAKMNIISGSSDKRRRMHYGSPEQKNVNEEFGKVYELYIKAIESLPIVKNTFNSGHSTRIIALKNGDFYSVPAGKTIHQFMIYYLVYHNAIEFDKDKELYENWWKQSLVNNPHISFLCLFLGEDKMLFLSESYQTEPNYKIIKSFDKAIKHITNKDRSIEFLPEIYNGASF